MRPLPLEIDPFLIASVQGNSAHSEEKVVYFTPFLDSLYIMLIIYPPPALGVYMALGVGPN